MSKLVKERERGSLIVISGPSGCGKGTVIDGYLRTNRDHSWLSVSCTSRAMRPTDKEGVNYYFISKEEFEKKIKRNEFLEYTEYNGNYYGTPKEYIEERLASGIDVLLEIEVQGAMKVKELLPESIFIFIMPPSMEELKNRLVGRGTENIDSVFGRFKRAYKEINEYAKYNYVITNDEIDKAILKMQSIIISEKCRVDRIEEVYLANEAEEIHELLLDDKHFINKDVEI